MSEITQAELDEAAEAYAPVAAAFLGVPPDHKIGCLDYLVLQVCLHSGEPDECLGYLTEHFKRSLARAITAKETTRQ